MRISHTLDGLVATDGVRGGILTARRHRAEVPRMLRFATPWVVVAVGCSRSAPSDRSYDARTTPSATLSAPMTPSPCPVAYAGHFDSLVGADGPSRTALVRRDGSSEEPDLVEYLVVRTDDGSVTQRAAFRAVRAAVLAPSVSALETAGTREQVATLVDLAHRFHREGAWLTLLNSRVVQDPGQLGGERSWSLRADADSRVLVDALEKHTCFERSPTAASFLPVASSRCAAGSSTSSERVRMTPHGPAEYTMGLRDWCADWENGAHRKRLSCNSIVQGEHGVPCDRGICAYWTHSGLGTEFVLFRDETGETLATGQASTPNGLRLRSSETDRIVLDFDGAVAVVDLPAREVRTWTGPLDAMAASLGAAWMGADSLLAEEANSDGRRLRLLQWSSASCWSPTSPIVRVELSPRE